jgi:hypothetical protein
MRIPGLKVLEHRLECWVTRDGPPPLRSPTPVVAVGNGAISGGGRL